MPTTILAEQLPQQGDCDKFIFLDGVLFLRRNPYYCEDPTVIVKCEPGGTIEICAEECDRTVKGHGWFKENLESDALANPEIAAFNSAYERWYSRYNREILAPALSAAQQARCPECSFTMGFHTPECDTGQKIVQQRMQHWQGRDE